MKPYPLASLNHFTFPDGMTERPPYCIDRLIGKLSRSSITPGLIVVNDWNKKIPKIRMDLVTFHFRENICEGLWLIVVARLLRQRHCAYLNVGPKNVASPGHQSRNGHSRADKRPVWGACGQPSSRTECVQALSFYPFPVLGEGQGWGPEDAPRPLREKSGGLVLEY